MISNRKAITASLIGVILLSLSAAAFAAEANIKGMITGRAGDTLIVRGDQGQTIVVLTGTTNIKDNTGLFGLSREPQAATILIPGLKVSVKGAQDAKGRVTATTITVDGDDIETSQMIQSGVQPTADQVIEHEKTLLKHQEQIGGNQQQIATNKADIDTNQQEIAAHKQRIEQSESDIEANTKRFMALSDYDAKGEATIKFASGSTKVSAQDMQQLKDLAEKAKGLSGYIVEVVGYADSTGNASMNTKLSENRAKAVVTVLMQQGGVPARYIVAPGAMGEYGSAAPNETKEGRADNRRVEVKVLVNKGISGS
jgi:outer membrane protein OmpA-like peptidoglycan-associated protein